MRSRAWLLAHHQQDAPQRLAWAAVAAVRYLVEMAEARGALGFEGADEAPGFLEACEARILRERSPVDPHLGERYERLRSCMDHANTSLPLLGPANDFWLLLFTLDQAVEDLLTWRPGDPPRTEHLEDVSERVLALLRRLSPPQRLPGSRIDAAEAQLVAVLRAVLEAP